MHFLTRLTPSVNMIRTCHIFIAIIGVWGIGTIFAIAFGCPLPAPWDITTPGYCGKQSGIYYTSAIIDLITDAAITGLPVLMMWSVQIPRGQRLTVMSVFLVRAFVCFAEIPRIVYISRWLNSTDTTFAMVDVAIWTQAVTNLSIITACIPCLKPFLASLGSGVLDTRLPSGFESRADYSLNSGGNTKIATENSSGNHSNGASPPRSRSNLNFYGGGKTNQIRTNIEGQTGNDRSNINDLSLSESKTRLTNSQDKEDRIYRTTEFVMDVDDSPPSSSRKRN
jgi:hypothetical protein